MNDMLEHRTEITAQGYRTTSLAQFGGKFSDGTVQVISVEVPFGGERGRAHAMREAIRVSQRMMERGLLAGLTAGFEASTRVTKQQIDAGKGRQK
jgi:hypothetical protein